MVDTKKNWDFDDLRPKERTFSYLGRKFIAREPSAGAWAEHDNARIRSYKYNAEGKLEKFDGLSHLEALLVGLCVFEEGKPAPIGDESKGWQARVVSGIYDWLVEAANGGATEVDVPPKPSAAGPS